MTCKFNWRLWIAQGFGIGRIPFAPGTFGTLVGFAWFLLLLSCQRFWLFLLGSLAGLALSVWLCGAGERTLGRKDPGSVVLDEIAAIPFCYLGWVWLALHRNGAFPAAGDLLAHGRWPLLVVGFVAFRFFDILKPWPVRQSQHLVGGWGITIDDFLAALYANLPILLAEKLL